MKFFLPRFHHFHVLPWDTFDRHHPHRYPFILLNQGQKPSSSTLYWPLEVGSATQLWFGCRIMYWRPYKSIAPLLAFVGICLVIISKLAPLSDGLLRFFLRIERIYFLRRPCFLELYIPDVRQKILKQSNTHLQCTIDLYWPQIHLILQEEKISTWKLLWNCKKCLHTDSHDT